MARIPITGSVGRLVSSFQRDFIKTLPVYAVCLAAWFPKALAGTTKMNEPVLGPPASALTSGVHCVQNGAISVLGTAPATQPTTNMRRIKITVGKRSFTATLQDNAAARAFKSLLPLTLKMGDVNDNEKYFKLSSDLPTDDANPGTVRTGDLMLWNSRGIVLFYKTFPTSYRYTKLGRVDDPAGLAEALGSEDVTVTFYSP